MLPYMGISHISTYLSFPQCCVWCCQVGTFSYSELKMPQVLCTSLILKGKVILVAGHWQSSGCVGNISRLTLGAYVHISLCQNCHSWTNHSWYKNSPQNLIGTLYSSTISSTHTWSLWRMELQSSLWGGYLSMLWLEIACCSNFQCTCYSCFQVGFYFLQQKFSKYL